MERSSFILPLALTSVCVSVLAGCNGQEITTIPEQSSQPATTSMGASSDAGKIFTASPQEPVIFSTGNLDVTIKKELRPAATEFADMKPGEKGDRCGPAFSAEYLTKLRNAFKGKQEIFYTIEDPHRSFQKELYYIRVVPNAMHYQSEKSVRNDFDFCAAGIIPFRAVSDQYIYFAGSACGGASAYGDQCDAVEKIVSMSLAMRF